MHLSTRLLLRARTFSTCHASVCTSLSSPLSYDTSWPLASPSPDEVTIAVAGTGVNFAEILQTRGLYQEKKEPPFVPGNECAGEVTQVGANVTNLKIGDQVICLARGNGYASHVTSSSASCIKLPDSARSKDLTEAAALMVNYGTAHLALTSRANLQPNEHVLVTAAAGGVGLAACELAKLMGAGSVIAACGSDDKITLARTKGAQELGVNYRDLDQREVKQAIKEAAPNGVDIVIDMVGADVLEPAVRSLNWSGRAVVIGFAGGSIPKIPTNLLLVKNVSVSGLFWGAHMIHEPKTLLKSANQLVEWWAEGRITPHVCARVPLKEANKAFELLEGRTSVGKVVLVPN